MYLVRLLMQQLVLVINREILDECLGKGYIIRLEYSAKKYVKPTFIGYWWLLSHVWVCVFHFSYVLRVHKSLGIFSLNANESQLDLVPPRPSQVELFLWVACCEEVLSWGLGIVMNMPRQKGAGNMQQEWGPMAEPGATRGFISKYFDKNTAREVWAGQVENTEEGWHTKQVWLAV